MDLWEVTKFFPVTTSFVWRFCFSLRTSYKKLIWCTNNPNFHVCNFRKRWSFIWRCFFSLWVSSVQINMVFKSSHSSMFYKIVFPKVNKSEYIACPIYQFCWQYAIILVWKTWCTNISMKNMIKCIKSVKLLNVKSFKCNGNYMTLLSTGL